MRPQFQSRLAATWLLALGLASLWPGARLAQARPKPIPPTLLRYAQTVQTVPSLAVTVTLTDTDNQATDTASLAFARPNLFRLVSRGRDGLFSEAVSDGTDLRQWDKRQSYTGMAPPRLDRTDFLFPLGSAARLVCALFLHKGGLGAPTAWRTLARVRMQGIAADKLSDRYAATLWLAASTGLPLRLIVHSDTDDYAAVFQYHNLFKALPPSVFAEAPPDNTTPLQSFGRIDGPSTYVPDMALGSHRIYLVASLVRTSLQELAGLGVTLADGWATPAGVKKLQAALEAHTLMVINVKQFSVREDTMRDLPFGTRLHPIVITVVPRMGRAGRVALEVTSPVQATVSTEPGATAALALSDPAQSKEDTFWLLLMTPSVRGG